jgi:hypothetical protein
LSVCVCNKTQCLLYHVYNIFGPVMSVSVTETWSYCVLVVCL